MVWARPQPPGEGACSSGVYSGHLGHFRDPKAGCSRALPFSSAPAPRTANTRSRALLQPLPSASSQLRSDRAAPRAPVGADKLCQQPSVSLPSGFSSTGGNVLVPGNAEVSALPSRPGLPAPAEPGGEAKTPARTTSCKIPRDQFVASVACFLYPAFRLPSSSFGEIRPHPHTLTNKISPQSSCCKSPRLHTAPCVHTGRNPRRIGMQKKFQQNGDAEEIPTK